MRLDQIFTFPRFDGAMMIPMLFLGLYIALNLFTFFVYRGDKEAARYGRQRVPERRLLWLAFLGGSLGAFAAQQLLRHKTRKQPFRTILLAILVFHLGLGLSLMIMPEWPVDMLFVMQDSAQKSKP